MTDRDRTAIDTATVGPSTVGTPYSSGRVVHDADAHIMETPTWLADHADPGVRGRIEPLRYPGGNELRQTGDVADQQRDPLVAFERLAQRHRSDEYLAREQDEIMRRPRVDPDDRATVNHLGRGIYQIILNYGFMEEPDVSVGLQEGDARALDIDVSDTTFILGTESIRVTQRQGMAIWREHLYAFLTRNATPAAAYFGLPLDRTMTISTPVDL